MSFYTQEPYAGPADSRHIPYVDGPLKLITPVAATLISSSDILRHLKQDHLIGDTDEEAYVTRLVKEAMEFCEGHIPGERQFLSATYDLPVACWWGSRALQPPRPPLISVTHIKYYDDAGVEQTLAASFYETFTFRRAPGQIVLKPSQSWPTTQADKHWPITVRFVAGYGVAASDVPETLKQAVFLIVAHSYRYRGDDDERGRTSELTIPPAAVSRLEKNYWGGYA